MKRQPFAALLTAFQVPIFRKLWKFLLPLFFYSTLVVVLDHFLPELGATTWTRHAAEAVLTGILFGWFLGFRTNAAYARWWEGRVLWGQLINESRNLSLKARCLFMATPATVVQLSDGLVSFADELRLHLRSTQVTAHRPLAIAGEIMGMIYAENSAGRIDGWQLLTLNEHAKALMEICGGCERIKNTPLPASYRGLLRQGIATYMLILPWFLAGDLGWLTIPTTLVVGYALIGLEIIAETIESPFDADPDHLTLDEMVATIRRNIAR